MVTEVNRHGRPPGLSLPCRRVDLEAGRKSVLGLESPTCPLCCGGFRGGCSDTQHWRGLLFLAEEQSADSPPTSLHARYLPIGSWPKLCENIGSGVGRTWVDIVATPQCK